MIEQEVNVYSQPKKLLASLFQSYGTLYLPVWENGLLQYLTIVASRICLFLSLFIFSLFFFPGKDLKWLSGGLHLIKFLEGKRLCLRHSFNAKTQAWRTDKQQNILFICPSNKPLLFPIKMISSEWKCIFVWNPRSQSLQLAPTDIAAFHRQYVCSK